MIEQLEDCVDGLSINKINIQHAGDQPKMRDAFITADLLGPHHSNQSSLQPGMFQKMCLSENDTGPCYLSPSQREKHCYDITTDVSYQKRIPVHKFKKKLKEAGIIKPVGNWHNLAKQGQNLNIPTHYTKESTKPGWVNKPKPAKPQFKENPNSKNKR